VLRLVTIPISHYCEKARWALERAGLARLLTAIEALLRGAGLGGRRARAPDRKSIAWDAEPRRL